MTTQPPPRDGTSETAPETSPAAEDPQKSTEYDPYNSYSPGAPPTDVTDIQASPLEEGLAEVTFSVVFTPSGRRGEAKSGTTILQLARQMGVDLDTVCGGRAICGRCQIVPTFGHFPKHRVESKADHLNPLTTSEKAYKKVRGMTEERRLGCQCRINGDLVIDVPPESQIHRQIVRKEADVRVLRLDPSFRLFFCQVAAPRMEVPRGAWERFLDALQACDPRRNWTQLHAPLGLKKTLPGLIGEHGGKLTVAVNREKRIIGLWAGYHEQVFGAAIDVGSTTVSVHVIDLRDGAILASAGAMNQQIRFGEDLMSRVSYALLHEGGQAEMTRIIRAQLDQLLHQAATEAAIDPRSIIEIVLVGNPIMHHLWMDYDVVPLGQAPFALTSDFAATGPASFLGFRTPNPWAEFHSLPLIAGHVGADAAAVCLSEALWEQEKITLLVDVGTNAEIMLGNRERILACSSPTGPALEGAQISSGQRAASGAIERVRIDPETYQARFRIIGCELWSDEAGFDEEARALGGVTGICGSGLIEVIAEMFLAGILTSDGVIRTELAARSERVCLSGRTADYLVWPGPPEIRVTQADIRAVQLAKGALYAGAKLLMAHHGIDRVEQIILAGAFGSHLDPKYTMILGMIPDCPLEFVRSVGNAAGTGARLALLNYKARREIERRVRAIEKIETALEPDFQKFFVQAMGIPNAHDPFPDLRRAVALPAFIDPEPARTRRGERRRAQRSGEKAESNA